MSASSNSTESDREEETAAGNRTVGETVSQPNNDNNDNDDNTTKTNVDLDLNQVEQRHKEYQEQQAKRRQIANYIFSSFSGSSDENDTNTTETMSVPLNSDNKGINNNDDNGIDFDPSERHDKFDQHNNSIYHTSSVSSAVPPSSSLSSSWSSFRWRNRTSGGGSNASSTSTTTTTDDGTTSSKRSGWGSIKSWRSSVTAASASKSTTTTDKSDSDGTTSGVKQLQQQQQQQQRSAFSNTISTPVDEKLRELGLSSNGGLYSSSVISPANKGRGNTNDDSTDGLDISNSSTNDDDDGGDTYSLLPQSKIAAMSKMTLELVRDLTQVRPGDTVVTQYGLGEVIKKSIQFLDDDEDGESTMDRQSDDSIKLDPAQQTPKKLSLSSKNTTTTLIIQLSFGKLYHRQPDMIHKVLETDEYEQALEQLEQVRKLQLAVQCQQWNVPIVDGACVACLFQKPVTAGSSSTSTGTGTSSSTASSWKQRWSSSRRSTSSFGADSSSSFRSSGVSQRHADILAGACKATTICDVCGNPVCNNHIMHNRDGSKELFVMCVDCSFDLNQLGSTLGINHPQLQSNLDRLLQYYTRMVLQLSFCVPNIKELASHLTEREQRHSKIALGTNAVGFVGAALGVAGAVTLLTPAGAPILLAAIATQATSGVLQGGHALAKNMSSKDANRLADRCLGWHGLCLGILEALEKLRGELILQRAELMSRNGYDVYSKENTDLLNALMESGRRNISSSQQALEVWNALAYGTYQTTRQGLTGVAMTAQMGASYSQVITTSMATVPVVGAAFSVGCMAMDANNIASNLSRMQKPSEKAVALSGVVHSFPIHIPSTIQAEVTALLAAVNDFREMQEQAQQNQENDLIEQELEELNML